MRTQQEINDRIEELRKRILEEPNRSVRVLLKGNLHALIWVLKEW